jgi:autotransporter translocation and assembly factor TamB
MKKAIKIPLAGFSFIMFLVVLLLYLYFFTTVPEQQLNDWLSYYLSQKTGYNITVEKLSRDIWRKIRFEGVEIYFINGDQLLPAGHINSIEAHYSLKDIIFKDYHFSSVEISGLEFSLLPQQGISKATAEKAADSGGEPSPLEINIDKIIVDDAKLRTALVGDTLDIILPKLRGSFGSHANLLDIKVDTLMGNCPQKDFEVDLLSGEFSRAGDDWLIETLYLKTSKSAIELSGGIGKIDDPQCQLSLTFAPISLEEIDKFVCLGLRGSFEVNGNVSGNLNAFEGQLRGSGTLFDRGLDDFTLDYNFQGDTVYVKKYAGAIFKAQTVGQGFLDLRSSPANYEYKGNLTDLNLQNIGPDLYSSFTGEIDLKGKGLSEKTFKMAVDMDLTKADIDVYHPQKAIGEIDFDLAGISFHPGFRMNYKNTWVTFDGYLDYTGSIDLMGSADFADLADFTSQIFIQDLDGTGRADFSVTGPTLDFNVAGSFYSDSCRFYGLNADTCSFNLNLKSFISHRVGTVSGFWKGGNLYSVPIDSGYFSVLVSGEKNFLDTIYMENEHNRLKCSGLFDNGTIPPSLTIDTVTIVLWNDTVYNQTPLLIDAYDKEIEFNDFKLYSRSSKLDVQGTVTYEGQMALEINADSLEILPIIGYFYSEKKLSGMLSGGISIGGDFDLPTFDANFTIKNLSVDTTNVGDLNLQADYSKSRINLKSAELKSPKGLYTLTGYLPVNLSFTSESERFPSEPISARLIASGKSMSLVPVTINTVESFDGDFNVDIEFSGTYDNPSVNGNFSVENGIVNVFELVDPFTQVVVKGRMINDAIYIDTLSGYMLRAKNNGKNNKSFKLNKSGKNLQKGLITGSGTVKILGASLFAYDLYIDGKDCEFYSDSYDIQGVTDLSLRVTGSSPPLVSGTATLKRLDMREPFISFFSPANAEILEDSTSWDIKLEVDAGRNIWINNTRSVIELEGSADMQLGGNLVITRERGIYNTTGDLDVIRGFFYLASIKFKINQGTLNFNNPDTLDPAIDFDVTTKIRTKPDVATGGLSTSDLNLRITGTLTWPKIGTAVNSDYSGEDVLYILVNSIRLSGAEQNAASSIILSNLIDKIGGLVGSGSIVDDIDFTQESSKDNTGIESRVSVAKYISPKFYLSYSQRLSQEGGQTVGFEYILNNKWSFEAKQGTGDDKGVTFDIKLSYEF